MAPAAGSNSARFGSGYSFTTLLLDCDNTLALTEEHAFAATSETINTLLKDFGIRGQNATVDAHQQQLTQAALETLNVAHGDQHEANHLEDDTSSNASSATDYHQTYSTSSLLADYIGLPFRQILTAITVRHNISLTPSQLAHYVALEEQNVNTQITLHSPAAPGILPTLHALLSNHRFKHTAVVSSSTLPRVRTALIKAGLHPEPFPDGALYSAHDSLPKPEHKPSPAIYLYAVEKLGVSAAECIAVEDSISGCLAAVNAGIACVGYVGAYHDPGKRDVMAGVLRARGAVAVIGNWDEFEGVIAEIEAKTGSGN